jgi:hypothetical protein
MSVQCDQHNTEVTVTKEDAQTLWVLEDAPDVIKEFGWHQGSYGSPKSGFCLMGAIDKSCERLKVQNHSKVAQEAFAQVNLVLGGERTGSISAWNDAPTTTRRKVLSLLNKTAKQYRKALAA